MTNTYNDNLFQIKQMLQDPFNYFHLFFLAKNGQMSPHSGSQVKIKGSQDGLRNFFFFFVYACLNLDYFMFSGHLMIQI